MSSARKYLLAGGTFATAMSIGFVMQNGDALASRMVDDQALDQVTQEIESAALPAVPALTMPESAQSAVLDLPAMDTVPVRPDAPVLLAAADPEAVVTDAPALSMLDGADCTVTMMAEAGPAATANLYIDAPCSVDTSGTIHHQGMMFTILTDSDGLASVVVPVLSQEAVFIAEMSDGGGAAAIVSVPDFSQYDRAVLQWQGEPSMGIHALEFGAGFSEVGHVWAAAARDPMAALTGEGGFLTQLGAIEAGSPFLAEVYTYPSGPSSRDGQVDLSVEAQVTPTNCGRAISAQSIQVSPGSAPFALDLNMTMPGCEAVGEFLVLNSMLMSLTLASR